MADAAEEPGPADAMGCGRAVEIPEMGSVLVAGHSPLGAFGLRAAQAASVPLAGATPLGCEDAADMVEVVDACDDRLEEEPVRWTLFRGMNMAAPLGAPSALHACRFSVLWYWTGGATAVIGNVVGEAVAGRVPGHFSCSTPVCARGLTARRQSDVQECRQQRQERAAAGSYVHASQRDAVVGGCWDGCGCERARWPVGMSCALTGGRAHVRAIQALHDRHRTRRRVPADCDKVADAADRADRTAVVCGTMGMSFEEWEEVAHFRALSCGLRHAEWPAVRVAGECDIVSMEGAARASKHAGV